MVLDRRHQRFVPTRCRHVRTCGQCGEADWWRKPLEGVHEAHHREARGEHAQLLHLFGQRRLVQRLVPLHRRDAAIRHLLRPERLGHAGRRQRALRAGSRSTERRRVSVASHHLQTKRNSILNPYSRAVSACILSTLCACGSANPIDPPATHLATTPIQHVVFIVQENRSFNNLFMGFPNATTATYGYDTSGDKIPLVAEPLSTYWDIDHSSIAFWSACNGSGK